jgi:heme oxygenase (biliverdin-IX-beta and delta-forming)
MPAVSLDIFPEMDRGVRDALPKNVAGSGLRALLREKTSAAHARLDSALQAVELRSAPQYCRFLEAHAEVLLPLETALVHSGVRRLFADWDQRTRSRALVADIARLGGALRPFDLLERFDDAGVLGAMYVLEGSRLGAAVMRDIVAQSPDQAVRDATAYLSHGAQQRLWPSFLVMLEHHGARLDDATGAVDAAHQTFALFEAALSRIALPAATATAASDRP